MSKLFEDMINEITTEVSILTAIAIWREEEFSELEIEKKAAAKFDITKDKANEYMSRNESLDSIIARWK